MRRFLEFIFLSVLAIITSSCNRDEVLTAELPEIIIEGDGIYSVKVGEELRLAPDYRNSDLPASLPLFFLFISLPVPV